MIYFIQCGESGPIKIGHTKSLAARLALLQSANPHRLNPVGWMEGGRTKLGCIDSLLRCEFGASGFDQAPSWWRSSPITPRRLLLVS